MNEKTQDPFEVPSNNGWSVIRKVAPYLWEQEFVMRLRVVLAMLALLLSVAFTTITPFLMGYTVDALSPSEANIGYWLGFSAAILVTFYGISRIMGVGLMQLRDYFFAKVGQRALRKLALETFQHIHALSLRYHLTRKTGSMIRVIERGVKGVEFLLRFMLFSVGPLILQLSVAVLVFLIFLDWIYASIVVVTIVVYTWLTFMITELRVQIRKEMNAADQKANQRSLDSLLNYETVKYFAAEQREAERYDNAMSFYENAAVRTANSLALLNFVQSFAINIGLVSVMLLAIYEVNLGKLSVGDFVMVNAYMLQIAMPLNFLGTVYREIRQALIDMGSMFDLLQQEPEIVDVENASDLIITEGEVEFENLSFSYDQKRPIIKNLDLKIAPGKTVAIVGPSGSGKSTLARLAYRFYDPDEGSLKIDGQDLRDITQLSLRRAIGIVPQDTVLFNDSILYNIGYGRDNASREEIIAAAKAAQIHEFILTLPDGYQTEVGERGLKLSGGEKQRVGIARTLLKNPAILILDEATSALDTTTEKGIIEALKQMSEGRTVMTIAHRLSTVVHADEIIVLKEGEIEERGTHQELIAKQGEYARMWAQQQVED